MTKKFSIVEVEKPISGEISLTGRCVGQSILVGDVFRKILTIERVEKENFVDPPVATSEKECSLKVVKIVIYDTETEALWTGYGGRVIFKSLERRFDKKQLKGGMLLTE